MSTLDEFFSGLGGKTAAELPPPTPTVVPEPAPLVRAVSQKNLFSNPDANPVVLDLVLLKHFGVDWIAWLADTVFQEIETTFKTSIADVNRLKIEAVKTLHDTDSFWDHWEIFEKTILALNSVVPMIEYMQPLELGTLMAGVDMANQVREEKFAEEIGRYGAACFLYANVTYAPPPLEFCQPYISQPIYVCGDCHKHASALPPWDGLCESCAGHFQHDRPFSGKPHPEHVARGWGKNVTVQLTHDPTKTKARFEVLDKLPPADVAGAIQEVPEDIEAARLITAIDYTNYHRQQLKDQLSALRPWLEGS